MNRQVKNRNEDTWERQAGEKIEKHLVGKI